MVDDQETEGSGKNASSSMITSVKVESRYLESTTLTSGTQAPDPFTAALVWIL